MITIHRSVIHAEAAARTAIRAVSRCWIARAKRSAYLAGGADRGNLPIGEQRAAHFSLNHLLVVTASRLFSLRTRALQQRVEECPLNIQQRPGKAIAGLGAVAAIIILLSRPNDSSAVFASIPLVLFRHYISNPLVRHQLFSSSHH